MPRTDRPESGGESRSVRFTRRLRRRRRQQHLALALTTLVGVGAVLADRHDGGGREAAVSAPGHGPASPSPAGGARAGHDGAGDSEAASAIPSPTPSTGAVTPPAAAAAELPLSAAMARQVPAGTRQVVLVAGAGADSSTARVTLYEAGSTGWTRVASWPGHVGRSGWSERHVEGDLRTPVGVYRLSDAGGRLAAPSARLPYHRSSLFRAPESGPGFGDSAADAFDHVIAIDYNRVAGRSPLDRERPLGEGRGGGIWLHLDHNGPTHGCVSVPKAGLQLLLRRLDPGLHPVVVMGPRAVVAG
ncbi:L,D-transpeptidase family protein [Phycicoccus sp. M110.8]|uniref:L,D-transpeptidase family protein n=1 Tax=Phycicoccus sp. M110.8 TaxID=3075433 RepID=UPI0028FDA72C|nr:L,D-transpeptidase family protein [Phycicoccus sp. M110.8]MDU0314178.1 L,D-transpeptidase family protein [Phycicoccus sp. M110.8]